MEEENIEISNTNQNNQEIRTIARCEACNREFNRDEDLAMHNYAKHNIPINSSSGSKDSETSSGISKKTIFLIMGVLAVIIVSYFFMSGKSLTGNAASEDSGDVQRITLGFKNNYYPNTITVEAEKPVEVTLDNSVRGCFRSFNIRELGISYRSSGPSDTIKFTPTKKGSFEFACGMRMGYGTIIVA